MEAEREICALICRSDGLKAKEIAKELKIDWKRLYETV